MADKLIEFTDAAVEHLKKIVQDEEALGFRLTLKKAGCNGYMYIPDVVKKINSTDRKLDVNGLQVFIDTNFINKIEGTVVDFVEKGFGQKQIVFRNPKAAGECGCGESFNFED